MYIKSRLGRGTGAELTRRVRHAYLPRRQYSRSNLSSPVPSTCQSLIEPQRSAISAFPMRPALIYDNIDAFETRGPSEDSHRILSIHTWSQVPRYIPHPWVAQMWWCLQQQDFEWLFHPFSIHWQISATLKAMGSVCVKGAGYMSLLHSCPSHLIHFLECVAKGRKVNDTHRGLTEQTHSDRDGKWNTLVFHPLLHH